MNWIQFWIFIITTKLRSCYEEHLPCKTNCSTTTIREIIKNQLLIVSNSFIPFQISKKKIVIVGSVFVASASLIFINGTSVICHVIHFWLSSRNVDMQWKKRRQEVPVFLKLGLNFIGKSNFTVEMYNLNLIQPAPLSAIQFNQNRLLCVAGHLVQGRPKDALWLAQLDSQHL